MSIKMLVNGRHNGGRVNAGEVLTLNSAIEEQLITEGSAEEVAGEAQANVVADPNTSIQDGKTNDNGEPTAEEREATAAAAIEKIKKALDNQYKKDELAEAAKVIGVEFAFDATKGAIIEAAVAQGKAEALLK